MIDSKKYNYLLEIPLELSELFHKHENHLFLDFTYIPNFSNAYYIDGFHGDDRVYSYITNIINENLLDLSNDN